MVVEGKGLIAPKPERFVLTDHDLLAIYQGVKNINHYGDKKDTWSRGLIGGKPSALRVLAGMTRQEEPCVAGKAGEYAVWSLATEKFGNIFPPVDFTRRARGDEGIDLNLRGILLQLKTRVTSEKNLVRVTDNRGRRRSLRGNAHVFCSWNRDLFVHVLGWMRTVNVEQMPLEEGLDGWQNLRIPDEELLPMNRLWKEIEIRVHQ